MINALFKNAIIIQNFDLKKNGFNTPRQRLRVNTLDNGNIWTK